MPSLKSLQQQQYYAHPQNAFWPLMASLCGFSLSEVYADNVHNLLAHGFAVWDVLAACEREGSLDSAIVRGTEQSNAIDALLDSTASIKCIGLNGGAAHALLRRHHKSLWDRAGLRVVKLPSTSPAYAAMSKPRKAEIWAQKLAI